MPRRVGVCLLVALAATLECAAEEKYDIRFRAAAIGEPIRVEKEETRSLRTTITDSLGRKVSEHLEKQVETFVYVETQLERTADGGVGVLRRQYDKAQLKIDKTNRNHAFQGRTVLIRNGKPRFRFTYDSGQELGTLDAAPLDQEFNGGDEKFRLDHLLPGKPVPVGADWVIDMGPAIKDFLRTGRFAVDQSWATGSGHLTKSTPMGGAQFGQLLYRMEIPIVAMSVGGPTRSPVVVGSKATFELSLDLCIDGSLPEGTIVGTGEVKATAELAQPGGLPGRLAFVQKCDNREVRKLDKQGTLSSAKSDHVPGRSAK
jgi:hypothetical protein